MRALILFFFISNFAFGKSCENFDKLADYLNTQKFIKVSRDHKSLKREPQLDLIDITQAKSVAYRFPAFKDLGFGSPGGDGWKPYVGRHPKSVLNGKKIGWDIKNENGYARVRVDWDPEKGGHYNIEITQKKNGVNETHKLALTFKCGDKKCTEKQVQKMVEHLQ